MRTRMNIWCYAIGVLILLAGAVPAQSGEFPSPPTLFPRPLSPRIANYDIDVKLIPEKRLLEGQEILIWHNRSNEVITELQFHLYLNAFRNSKSTFMIESGGVSRGNRMDKDGWGFIEVNRMILLSKDARQYPQPFARFPSAEKLQDISGVDLSAGMEYIHPDNPEHVHDKTVLRVPLPEPLQPGESVVLYIDFTAKLPQPPFARTGAKKEFFFVGQWFPKIGVYTDKGWNCHQFHANSEFFADFGVYNVWMTVPAENIVGATGIEVGVRDNGDGTATHFYHAEDVHDFAWTTSPEFREFKGRAQDVEIRVLMQPDHADQGPRHVEAARVAVEYYQNWYGDYPYPNLTVVDPRRGAGGAGGMEYPTLITAGTTYGLVEGIRSVELVIIHEFGHNFWYHLLASNEFEESWLDEGINTYAEIQIMQDYYGAQYRITDRVITKLREAGFPEESLGLLEDLKKEAFQGQFAFREALKNTLGEALTARYGNILITYARHPRRGDSVDFLGIKLNDREFQRAQYISNPDLDPMLRRAWEYYSRTSYGVNSYSRPGIVLTTLQNYLGWETMLKVMRTYVERFRFKHPTSQDFVNVASEVAGEDLSWFFDQVLYTNAVLDYSVDRIITRKYDPGKGYDFDLSITEELTDSLSTSSTTAAPEADRADTIRSREGADTLSDLAGGEDTTRPAAESDTTERRALYYNEVDVRRLGDFIFPVEVEIVFDNGEVVRERWDGKGLWKKFHYLKPAKIVSATVDPDRKVVMDVNFTNNSKSRHAGRRGIIKITARLAYYLQYLMHQSELLNLLTFF
ncbi:MAG: M1 family peptidase [Calditrichaeota bacterium]|nr:MAG: M1 family peptidase [Calditrichota bacterium]